MHVCACVLKCTLSVCKWNECTSQYVCSWMRELFFSIVTVGIVFLSSLCFKTSCLVLFELPIQRLFFSSVEWNTNSENKQMKIKNIYKEYKNTFIVSTHTYKTHQIISTGMWNVEYNYAYAHLLLCVRCWKNSRLVAYSGHGIVACAWTQYSWAALGTGATRTGGGMQCATKTSNTFISIFGRVFCSLWLHSPIVELCPNCPFLYLNR